MKTLKGNQRVVVLIATLVLLCGSVGTVAAEAGHGHDQSQPCSICQLAHLPAVQASPISSFPSPEAVLSEATTAECAEARDAVPSSTSPRAPPSILV